MTNIFGLRYTYNEFTTYLEIKNTNLSIVTRTKSVMTHKLKLVKTLRENKRTQTYISFSAITAVSIVNSSIFDRGWFVPDYLALHFEVER